MNDGLTISQRNAKAFGDRTAEIVSHLPGTWTREQGDWHWNACRHINSEGHTLFFDGSGRAGHGRCVVRGSIEHNKHKRESIGPEIGFSMSKGPEKCAKDIIKRLWPDYLIEFEKAKQKHANEVERELQRVNLWTALCEVSGDRQALTTDQGHIKQGGYFSKLHGDDYIRGEVRSPQNVRLTLDVTGETALKIVQLFARIHA